jgi:hypothetical protein
VACVSNLVLTVLSTKACTAGHFGPGAGEGGTVKCARPRALGQGRRTPPVAGYKGREARRGSTPAKRLSQARMQARQRRRRLAPAARCASASRASPCYPCLRRARAAGRGRVTQMLRTGCHAECWGGGCAVCTPALQTHARTRTRAVHAPRTAPGYYCRSSAPPCWGGRGVAVCVGFSGGRWGREVAVGKGGCSWWGAAKAFQRGGPGLLFVPEAPATRGVRVTRQHWSGERLVRVQRSLGAAECGAAVQVTPAGLPTRQRRVTGRLLLQLGGLWARVAPEIHRKRGIALGASCDSIPAN